MKKYAIPVDKSVNKQKLLNALVNVGFTDVNPQLLNVNSPFWVINNNPELRGFVVDHDILMGLDDEHCIMLPSYVMEHAHKLDGAKPWLVAPKGYRIVTDEEIVKYGNTVVVDHAYYTGGNWVCDSGDGFYEPMCAGFSFKYYAVPVDFDFESNVRHLTVRRAETFLSHHLGCDVVIDV